MTTTQRRTAQGFRLEDCGRCGGTGNFGPLAVHNGRCFDCGGTGLRVVKADRAAWQAWSKSHGPADRDIVEIARRVMAGEPAFISIDRRWKGIAAVENVSVDPEHPRIGSRLDPETHEPTDCMIAWRIDFRLADGSTHRVAGNYARCRFNTERTTTP